jgi:D-threo-aldose 1-dehydrogenase
VVIGGVYNSGLLADPRPGARFDYVPAPAGLVRTAESLAELCGRFGVPLKAAAVQFPFRQPTVASVLVGCRSAAEVRDNAEVFEHPIPEELWTAIAKSGLVAEGAI